MSPARYLPCLLLAALLPAAAAPLTLDDAIRLALENNQRIKVSAYSPDIARANVLAETGRFDPALTFNRSYGEAEQPGIFVPPGARPLSQTDRFGLALEGLTPWGLTYSLGATATNARGTGNAFADQYETFGGLTVTQPLLRGFGFGANLAGLRIAKAGRGISDWQHRQTVIDTVTNVVLAFNNLQQAHANLRIARLSRDLAARLYEENRKRREVGSISDADVTQARARVANREESILIAERSVRDLENQLRVLIGDDAVGPDAPALPITELPPATDLTVDAAEDARRAFDLRPDYQAARLGLAIDRANLAVAQNSLLPRLDFVGSYGYAGSDPDFPTARQQVRDKEARAYSAGVVVRVPLTFAEGRGRARAARLAVRQTEADLVRLEQDIAVSIAAAAGQLATTRQRVEATRLAYELAQQALEAEEKRYKAGASSTFFVLQQQELLAAAQNSHARAQADQRRAQANYERETGLTLARLGLNVE